MESINTPRSALSRAFLFLDKAEATLGPDRNDFEAFLEASIVFARAAIHRFKNQHKQHPDWKIWWDSLAEDAAINFFRIERDFILKEGPPQIGQRLFAGFFDASTSITTSGYSPTKAAEFYFFDNANIPATETVRIHLGIVSKTARDEIAR